MWTSGIKEIFIAQHAIDFRKGADSLVAECYAMDLDPYRGECVVFIHRSRRAVKVIGGDPHGVWVLLRRFEGGSLRAMFPFLEDRSFVSATAGELAMLLEGATIEVRAKARPWKYDPQSDTTRGTVLPMRPDGKETVPQKNAPHGGGRATRRFPAGASVGERP
jgi:IS66 Orf2 like protein